MTDIEAKPVPMHRLATLVVAALLGLTAGLVVSAPAQAYAYNRQAAVNYVNSWYYRYNSAYQNFNNNGGDCTNFVSQAFRAGGIPFDTSGANQWYHHKRYVTGNWYWFVSPTFVRVREFRSYWYTFGSRYVHVEGATNLGKKYSPALPGDAYVYDSGGNPKAPDWIHANVSVGYHTGYDMYGQHSPGKTNTDWRRWYWTRSSSERGNFLKAGHGLRVISP